MIRRFRHFFAQPTDRRLVCWLVGLLAALVVTLAAGCEQTKRSRTSLFQKAEHHFKRGEYDAALDDYQVFLRRYPRSPLSQTARLRVRSINREIQSMMGRKDMPKPNYVGDSPDESTPRPQRPSVRSYSDQTDAQTKPSEDVVE